MEMPSPSDFPPLSACCTALPLPSLQFILNMYFFEWNIMCMHTLPPVVCLHISKESHLNN